jgi:hypothetical protein
MGNRSVTKPSGMTLDEERLHFFADLGKALDECLLSRR